MNEVMSITEFLETEREHRKAKKWWKGFFRVKNDKGEIIRVAVKSFNFHNQVLRVGGDPVNYAAGHTCETVNAMHKHIRDVINGVTTNVHTSGS